MEPNTQNLLQAVLALPTSDRVKLAEAVLESLDDDDQMELEDDLNEELERRAQELRTDPSSSLPWSEVKKLR